MRVSPLTESAQVSVSEPTTGLDEELICIEAEELAERLFGESYYDLDADLRGWVRLKAIEAFWPIYT